MIVNDLKKDPNYLFKLERNIKAYMLYTILILGISVILLSIAIATVMPLKEVKPYLMFFSSGESNFVRVMPANLDINGDVALIKSILAGYVVNREKINRIDDIERYEIVRMQSNKVVWQNFENIIKMPGSIYTITNLTREIRIINVSILAKDTAQVDYVAIQNNIAKSEKDYITKYRTSLKFEFKPLQDTSNNIDLKNPTGFRIIAYSPSKINEFDNITKEN